MLYVGLSVKMNFSFLFLLVKNLFSICSISPCFMTYIYCMNHNKLICKHMHSVFGNMTPAAMYLGVYEAIMQMHIFYFYHREVATPCV
jgi:hypothetical protein